MSDQFTHPYEEEKKSRNDERIIGCAVSGVYSSCQECRYKSNHFGCIQYRNRFGAEVTMGMTT